MNEVNNYDTDDVVPRGSPLLAIRPRLEPEPLTDWEGDNDTDLDDLISVSGYNHKLTLKEEVKG